MEIVQLCKNKDTKANIDCSSIKDKYFEYVQLCNCSLKVFSKSVCFILSLHECLHCQPPHKDKNKY